MNREQRALKAREWYRMTELNYRPIISNIFCNSKIYTPDSIFDQKDKTNIISIKIDDLDSVSAIFKYQQSDKKIAVLNFASYKNPGGNFLGGSAAQEEALCHCSLLYNVLLNFDKQYYEVNRKVLNKALYTNKAIYSPNMFFFKDDKSVILADVITCAAPNKKAAQKVCGVSDAENAESLRDRIRFVLNIAADNSVDTLILGAYGCGVFGQDPTETATIFKEEIEKTMNIKNIIFAIPNSGNGNYDAFFKVLMEEESQE